MGILLALNVGYYIGGWHLRPFDEDYQMIFFHFR